MPIAHKRLLLKARRRNEIDDRIRITDGKLWTGPFMKYFTFVETGTPTKT